MYIIKNALRSIARSKGRNILIGIIVLIIAVSSCIALSIKESAIKAKNDTLEKMNITAQISVDRQAMMASMSSGGFDRDAMKNAMQSTQALTLEEYSKYAEAESVDSFYFSLTASLDAGDGIEPMDNNGTFANKESDGADSQNFGSTPMAPGGNQRENMSGNSQGFKGRMGAQGDFTVKGYSSDEGMTGFVDGTESISDGAMFTEGTESPDCVISKELATYNNLAVGSSILLANPNDETETITLNVVGIYESSKASDDMAEAFSTAGDSANTIYMSYPSLKAIIDESQSTATETTDSKTGLTSSSAISASLNATYVFDGIEDYESFEGQVRDMGLSDTYTVSSNDVTSFEQRISPLENLSKMADYFLIVVLIIGAVILFVINIFNIRERKYEIGVMTAIGMKKAKVSSQFICELFAVTLCALIIGTAIGAATSVPVTNALLANQISANTQAAETVEQNFGRDTAAGHQDFGNIGAPPSDPGNENRGGKNGFMGNMLGSATDYISEVSYSTDLNVIWKLMLVGLGLTLVSSMSAVLFITRYEPLKILTNRD